MPGLKDIWAPVLLFVFVIGGLYGLPFLPRFTPTEAGGVGAAGAFIIGVVTGRLDREKILASLLQATRTAAAVFTVLIGALIFGYFLTVTQTPQKVTEFLTGLGLGPYGVLALIMVMYLVLGCLMDAMAMIILTVPIIFPVITHLGFDPIWFGVIIVMTVELGLIHPPVGMNVFVIKSVVKDVSFSTIFKGVIPFVATDLVRLVILIAFPLLATWLPTRMMAHCERLRRDARRRPFSPRGRGGSPRSGETGQGSALRPHTPRLRETTLHPALRATFAHKGSRKITA